MKFFKFNIEVFDYDESGSKHFFETHYLNVEEIKEIIVSSVICGSSNFIVKTRDGLVFYLKIDDLDSLLKLVDIDEKEAKK